MNRNFNQRKLALVSTVALGALIFSSAVIAAPQFNSVAAGSATVSTQGSTTTINQSSDRAIIAWDSFNLAASESANFVVPSSSSATLNRVSGGLSTISGSVTSNGTVYFSNPNGMVFDATSQVSTNGFVATTGTIGSFDFMNGSNPTAPIGGLGSASLSLNGQITAPTIHAAAGSLSVGGNLSAASGTMVLTSSSLTTIGKNAVISADAGANGTGGNIKVWSDGRTDFLGTITARGGSTSGNGGFVEVSGGVVKYEGSVLTTAAHGKRGTLLIDPVHVEIVSALRPSTIRW